jgi:hypothetical protein
MRNANISVKELVFQNKIAVYIFIFMLIIFILVIVLISYKSKNYLKDSIIVKRYTEISGCVFEKKFLTGGYLIILNDGKVLNCRNIKTFKKGEKVFFDWFLEEGDSIAKKYNCDTVYVFRNKKMYPFILKVSR